MSNKTRGADALVHSLKQQGVSRIFTLSGNHIMPLYDAAFGAGIELIHTRHEAAAVHMADAYARLTGSPAVALVTGGPGHANAISALYTAQMAESPVVLLSGHAPHAQRGMGAFQEMAQADMAAPVTKSSWTCESANVVAFDMQKAISTAGSGRPGPVHVSLPTDVLEASTSLVALSTASIHVPFQLGKDDVIQFIEKLTNARRPLILCGPSCTSRSGRERMAQLAAASGVPVVGMESPRGVADPSLGAFAQVLAESDCVLLLGKRMDFTLKFGAAPTFATNCTFLQIDPDEAELARAQRALGSKLIHTCNAPVDVAISQLQDAFRTIAREAAASTDHAWRDEVTSAIAYRPDAWKAASSSQPDRLHPVQALRPLQAILDSHPDSVFISDGGEIGQWAQACLHAPHRVINGVAGSIGAALPFALAARVAKADAPVIAVMGDGTFGFHSSEIDTAVRYGLPFLAVVGNDARWNAEYQIQLREYGANRLIGCELLPTRYDAVTAAFGGYGDQVTQADELMAAAHRAMASGLPACLNVMIEGLAAPNIKR